MNVFCCSKGFDADFLGRILMGGGSGCIVGRTTVGKKSLRMTDSGSMGIESCGPRCTDLQHCFHIYMVPGSGVSVDQG